MVEIIKLVLAEVAVSAGKRLLDELKEEFLDDDSKGDDDDE
ncbi:hypothetical protein [Geomonas propionica]|nr:hypothetical protein [Geomonas propionica]